MKPKLLKEKKMFKNPKIKLRIITKCFMYSK